MKTKKGFKKSLAVFLAALLALSSMWCMTAFAADEPLTVKAEDGTELTATDGVYTITESGNYTATGTGDDTNCIIFALEDDAEATLTLDGTTLAPYTTNVDDYEPAIGVESGTLNLILADGTENSVTGGLGKAGIYVAIGATVIISGNGSLTATGGADIENAPGYMDYCGGAGIGGNGESDSEGIENWSQPSSFGTVTINGGNITATGGESSCYEYGAGAGIGSGGTWACWFNIRDGFGCREKFGVVGEINITGGTITATGGNNTSKGLTAGGAGIGSGGSYSVTTAGLCSNHITINISGGTIEATGMADGTGIGGGATVDSGTVNISGGDIKAYGSCEIENGEQYGAYGGAGIGGGDEGGVAEINITGGTVYAKAAGAAAGIGSGSDYLVGKKSQDDNDEEIYLQGSISIGGDAVVTAVGSDAWNSSHTTHRGGAGIGSGAHGNSSHANDCGALSVTGNAVVRAFAGYGAQAIGIGSGQDEKYTKVASSFHVGNGDADIWCFNQDTIQPAFWGQDTIGTETESENYTTDGAYAVWYTAEDEDMPEVSTSTETGEYNDKYEDKHSYDFTWQYETEGETSTVSIYYGDDEVASGSTPYTLGNWATFTTANPTVTFELGSSMADLAETFEPLLPEEANISFGTEYTPETPQETVQGYKFTGWFTDAECTEPFEDGTAIYANTTLYGAWEKIQYNVTYEFTSATDGVTLPDGITALLPEPSTATMGDEVTLATITETSFTDEENDGVWAFTGWSIDGTAAEGSFTMGTEDVTVTGSWEFTANAHSINYSFESGTEGLALPDEISQYIPAAGSGTKGEEVELANLDAVTFTDEENDGVWVFTGWYIDGTEATTVIMGTEDVTVTGTWEFKANEYTVSYTYASSTEGKELPEDLLAQLPSAAEETAVKGDVVSPLVLNITEYEDYDNDGTWAFTGWQPESITIGEDEATFTGTWAFTANEYSVTYTPVSADGTELPEEILALTPTVAGGYVMGDAVTLAEPETTSIDILDEEGNVTGTWNFVPYTDATVTIGREDVSVSCVWEYTPNEDYNPSVPGGDDDEPEPAPTPEPGNDDETGDDTPSTGSEEQPTEPSGETGSEEQPTEPTEPTEPDKSDLQDAADDAQSVLDEIDPSVPEDLVKDLEDALARVEEVLSDENATQEDIDAALADLQAALDAINDAMYTAPQATELVEVEVVDPETGEHYIVYLDPETGIYYADAEGTEVVDEESFILAEDYDEGEDEDLDEDEEEEDEDETEEAEVTANTSSTSPKTGASLAALAIAMGTAAAGIVVVSRKKKEEK